MVAIVVVVVVAVVEVAPVAVAVPEKVPVVVVVVLAVAGIVFGVVGVAAAAATAATVAVIVVAMVGVAVVKPKFTTINGSPAPLCSQHRELSPHPGHDVLRTKYPEHVGHDHAAPYGVVEPPGEALVTCRRPPDAANLQEVS